MQDPEFFAPLDPSLLSAYQQKSGYAQYNESADVWALGITTLCFLFSEDFVAFYDWNKYMVNFNKIQYFLDIMRKLKYDSSIFALVAGMLEPSEVQRINLDQLQMSILNK